MIILIVSVVVLLSAEASGKSDKKSTWLDPCGAEDISCTDQRGLDKRLAFPENCSQYLQCTGNGKLRIKDCGRRKFFNNATNHCEHRNYQCQSSCPDGAYTRSLERIDPCGTEEIACADQASTFKLPFPENCKQYLVCTEGGRLRIKDCKADKSFDIVNKNCTSNNYQCQSSCANGTYVQILDRSVDESTASQPTIEGIAQRSTLVHHATSAGHSAVTTSPVTTRSPQVTTKQHADAQTSAESQSLTETSATASRAIQATSGTNTRTNRVTDGHRPTSAPVTVSSTTTGGVIHELTTTMKNIQRTATSHTKTETKSVAGRHATAPTAVASTLTEGVKQETTSTQLGTSPTRGGVARTGRSSVTDRHRTVPTTMFSTVIASGPRRTTSPIAVEATSQAQRRVRSSQTAHSSAHDGQLTSPAALQTTHHSQSVIADQHITKSAATSGDKLTTSVPVWSTSGGTSASMRRTTSQGQSQTSRSLPNLVATSSTPPPVSSSQRENTASLSSRAAEPVTSPVSMVTGKSTFLSLGGMTTDAGTTRDVTSRVMITSRRPGEASMTTLKHPNQVIAELAMPGDDLLEGHRAEFVCTASLGMAHLENVSWFLNSLLLSNDTNSRIKVITSITEGQLRSTLVLDPAKFSDTGELKCIIYYGGAYISRSSIQEIFIVPLPRPTSIHPLTATSERDVTLVVTCSAEFPSVSHDVTARVTWLEAGSSQPIRDVQSIVLHAGIFSPDNEAPETIELRRTAAGGIVAAFRLNVSVTEDAEYVCRWTTDAGPASNLTCIVSVISDASRTCRGEMLGDVQWSKTRAGRYDRQQCPPRFTGIAQRQCGPTGVWSPPNYNDCVSKRIDALRQQAEELDDGLRPINSTDVTSILRQLLNATSEDQGQGQGSGSVMSAADISASIDIMSRVARIHSARRRSLTLAHHTVDAMSLVTSNMLDDVNADSWRTLLSNKSRSRGAELMTSRRDDVSMAETLMWSLNELSEVFAEQMSASQTPFNQTSANLMLQIGRSRTVRSLPVWDQSHKSGTWSSSVNDSFQLPESSWLNDVIEETDGVVYMSSCARNLQNYLPQPSESSHGGASGNASGYLNSPIMSLEVMCIPDVLDPPISITVKHLQPISTETQQGSCVFWDFERGRWSTENVKVTSSNVTHTSCEVKHLTNFAILVSPYTPTGDLLLALSIISMVGCIISSACLLFTVVFYIAKWKTMKSHRAVVLLNLCVALFVANVVFLAGVDKVQPKVVCTVVAVLLHYFFLSAFFLMLVEGIQLSIYVFAVFHIHRMRDTAAMIFAAWFVSLMIVGISVGVTRTEGYGGDRHCWLSADSGLLLAFIIPAMTVVLVNAVIMVLVLRRIATANVRSDSQRHRNKVKSLIRNILVILPVLGLTWVFGVVAINSQLVAFQFIFAIANSMQGLFIFIFHAFCHGKSSASTKKSSSSQWNRSSRSAQSAVRHSNGVTNGHHHGLLNDHDLQQCISRRHRPYVGGDIAMTTASAEARNAADDECSDGIVNPGYEAPLPAATNGVDPPLPSPVSRELAHQSEVVRDASVVRREDSDLGRWRRPGRATERPGLSRLVSVLSDVSNTTTSTFVSWTPSELSAVDSIDERL